jgi:PAS domain S-box-containing protein
MMRDTEKKRKQLLEEITALRSRLEQFEDAEGKWKRTEDALRQSERDKSLILGSLSELITYQDDSMKVVWANKAAGDSVGQSPEELVGRYCYEIWHGRKRPCLNCPVAKSIETGRPQEDEVTSPDGRVWYIRSCPVLNEQGDVIGIVEITTDITERKRSENLVVSTKARLEHLLSTSSAVIYSCETSGNYTATFISQNIEEVLGYEPEEFIKDANFWFDRIHPEDKPRVSAEVPIIFKKGRHAFEYRFKHRDGTYRWVRDEMKLVCDSSGNPMEIVGCWIDITARKHAEEALRERETLLQTVIDSTKDAMISIGEDGLITLFNPAAEEMFGRTSEEMIGEPVDCLMPKEYRRQHREYVESYFATGKPDEAIGKVMELPGLNRDGNVFPMAISLSPGMVNGKRFVIAVARDITERKQAEIALYKSEEKFRSLVANMPVAVWSSDTDGTNYYVSRSVEAIYGYTPEEVYKGGENLWFSRIHPDDVNKVKDAYKRLFSDDAPLEIEYRIKRKDGHWIWIADKAQARSIGNGNRYYVGVFSEVTERKEAGEKLQESEERFRHVFENTTIGIYRTTPNGRILMANPALVQMLGYESFDELAKRNLEEDGFEPGYPRSAFKQRIERDGQIIGMEFTWTRRDGTRIFIRENARRIADNEGNTLYYEGTIEDITERKQAEEQIRIRDKAIESSISAISIAEPGGKLIYVNPAFLKMWGYDDFREVVGKPVVQFWQFEDQAIVVKVLHAKGKWTGELSAKRKDGTKFDVQIMASIVKTHVEKPVYMMASFMDITERKKAARELEYRMNFEELITSISTNFINLPDEDVDNGINQALKTLGEFAGVDRSYIFQFFDGGKNTSNTHEWCAEGITPQSDNLQNLSVDSIPWWMDKLGKFENIHIPDVAKLPGRARNERGILQVQSIKSLIVIPMVYNRRLIGFTGFDSVRRKRAWSKEIITLLTIVSEIFSNTLMRKRVQQELNEYHEKMFRAEQLASLGTVSATIAHELNQPLTVIQLFLQQGLRAAKESRDVKVTETITDSLAEVSKAAAIVDRFRRFARKSSPRRDISEINPVEIANRIIIVLAESARRAKLNLSINVKSCPSHILGNVVEFERIFFVLVQNAIQAADGEAWRDLMITISSQNGRLQLTFADTCGGIEQENIDKIFEPFFTTKPADIGTGLGLCILERIVKRKGGSVRVESRAGHGTVFYISLPVRN